MAVGAVGCLAASAWLYLAPLAQSLETRTTETGSTGSILTVASREESQYSPLAVVALLGAAFVLAVESAWNGRVRFVFQGSSFQRSRDADALESESAYKGADSDAADDPVDRIRLEAESLAAGEAAALADEGRTTRGSQTELIERRKRELEGQLERLLERTREALAGLGLEAVGRPEGVTIPPWPRRRGRPYTYRPDLVFRRSAEAGGESGGAGHLEAAGNFQIGIEFLPDTGRRPDTGVLEKFAKAALWASEQGDDSVVFVVTSEQPQFSMDLSPRVRLVPVDQLREVASHALRTP